jgi:hypothetical protein
MSMSGSKSISLMKYNPLVENLRPASNCVLERSVVMSDFADINVLVTHDCDLVVTRPGTGEQATYRKDGASPVLVLTDSMRGDPDPERMRFLVSAWKAAHAKAQQLGWLKS